MVIEPKELRPLAKSFQNNLGGREWDGDVLTTDCLSVSDTLSQGPGIEGKRQIRPNELIEPS